MVVHTKYTDRTENSQKILF